MRRTLQTERKAEASTVGGGTMRTGVAGARWRGVSAGHECRAGEPGGALDVEGHGRGRGRLRQLQEPQKWALQTPFLVFVLAFQATKKGPLDMKTTKNSTYKTCEKHKTHTQTSNGLEFPHSPQHDPSPGHCCFPSSATPTVVTPATTPVCTVICLEFQLSSVLLRPLPKHP